MRLTSRALRLLTAIAAEPGLSDSEARERAGFGPDSQVSRLLTRLADNGLIKGARQDHASGTKNAWRVTARGKSIARVIGHARAV
jgi:predicted transcriptional regulator